MLLLLQGNGNSQLKEELSKIEKKIIEKHKEIENLNFRKKHILSKLREMESILNPQIEVKRIVSSKKNVEDYYRATAWIWVNDKKERVVSYVGLCKNFDGNENSEDVKKVARLKINETISNRHEIIIQNENLEEN
jgi:hypothetical protein